MVSREFLHILLLPTEDLVYKGLPDTNSLVLRQLPNLLLGLIDAKFFDLVGDYLGIFIDSVPLFTRCLLGIVYAHLGQVLFLSPEDDNCVGHHHKHGDNNVLNIDPEDLAAIPSEKEVIDARGESWDINEGDLEEGVPVHSLVVFRPVHHPRVKVLCLEQEGILQPEKLERGDQREDQDRLLRFGISHRILQVEDVRADDLLFVELVPDTIDDYVADEGKYEEHRRCCVAILDQEKHHVEPEADQPGTL